MIATKIFTFCAAHRLTGHWGKCVNLHGHTYKLEVGIEGDPDEKTQMVLDFGIIKEAVDPLIEYFDHSLIINENGDEIDQHLLKTPKVKIARLMGIPTTERLILIFKEAIERKLVNIDSKLSVKLKLWESESSYISL